MKNLPAWMNINTTTSRIIATVLFIILPFIGFYIGTLVAKTSVPAETKNDTVITSTPVVTTSTVTTNTPVATTTVADPYAGWTEYKNETYGIAFKLPPQVYTDDKLVTVTVKSIPTEVNCGDNAAYAVLKNQKDCINGKVVMNRTEAPGLYIIEPRGIGGDCMGEIKGGEYKNIDNGIMNILGEDFKVSSYYNTNEGTDLGNGSSNPSCNDVGFTPVNNLPEGRGKFKASPTSKFTYIWNIDIVGMQDKPGQKGLSEVAKLVLKSLRYY